MTREIQGHRRLAPRERVPAIRLAGLPLRDPLSFFFRQDQKFPGSPPLQIAILDDDHVIRIARYALSGPGEVSESYVRDFFLPEEMDPATVLHAGRGLHEADGVSLVPMAARFDLRNGSDVSVVIFRRGAIDAAAMDANPRLKLIQRIGARADSIDLAAAATRN